MKRMKVWVFLAIAVCNIALAQENVAVQPVEFEPVEIPVQAPIHEASAIKSDQSDEVSLSIGLNYKIRKEVVDALNILLADEFMLYTKTLKYHWNVRGPHFGPLHELFGKQYQELQGFVDGIAERIRAFGFFPPATLAEFAAIATLQEQLGHNPDDAGMIADLLKDHEQIIRNLRKYIDLTAKLNDMGTNNYLADLITKHEKTAWMLRAHLE